MREPSITNSPVGAGGAGGLDPRIDREYSFWASRSRPAHPRRRSWTSGYFPPHSDPLIDDLQHHDSTEPSPNLFFSTPRNSTLNLNAPIDLINDLPKRSETPDSIYSLDGGPPKGGPILEHLSHPDSPPRRRTHSHLPKRPRSLPPRSVRTGKTAAHTSPIQPSFYFAHPTSTAKPLCKTPSTSTIVISSPNLPPLDRAMAGMTQLELLWSDLSFRQSAKEDQGEPSKQLIYALLSSCVEDDAIVHQRFMEGPLGWSDSVACFPDAVRNNPAVMPIVEIIEGLLREEILQREKAEEEIASLQADLEGIDFELSEAQKSGNDFFDLELPIFEKLTRVRRQFRASQNLLNERKRMLEDLTERSRELKEELLDLMPFEFQVSTTGYSKKSLALHEENLRHLGLEKDRRWNSIATLHTDLLLIYSQIGFPLKTSKDEELSSFLHQSSVTNTSDVDILSREFESLRSDFLRIIDGKPRAERKWFQALSRSCIAELEERRDYGRNRLSEMLRECRIVVREIELFWVQLDVPEEQRFPISVDVRRLEEFKTVADKLRVGWKKLMGGELIETMESMQSMWRKCHISRDEQEQTKKGFPPNFFSPLTVEFLRHEIVVLEERYELEKHLIQLIEQRTAYIEKLKEFEQDASDPDRLFKASFRLLEEEKFRKASVPILLKMETTLRGLVQEFEAEKYPFFFEGRRWIQTLDQELQDRFINKALFIFDTSHLRQTRVAIPPSSPTRRGSRSSASNASSNSLGARSQGSHSVRSSSPTPYPRPTSPISPTVLDKPMRRLTIQTPPDSSPRRRDDGIRTPSPQPWGRTRSYSNEQRHPPEMVRQTSRPYIHRSPPPSPQPFPPIPFPSTASAPTQISRIRSGPGAVASNTTFSVSSSARSSQRPSSYHSALPTPAGTSQLITKDKISRRLTMPNIPNVQDIPASSIPRPTSSAGVPIGPRSSSIPVRVAAGAAKKGKGAPTNTSGNKR